MFLLPHSLQFEYNLHLVPDLDEESFWAISRGPSQLPTLTTGGKWKIGECLINMNKG